MQGTALHAKTCSVLGLIIYFKERKNHPSLVVNIELVGAKFIFPRVVTVVKGLQETFLQLP